MFVATKLSNTKILIPNKNQLSKKYSLLQYDKLLPTKNYYI